MKVSTSIKVRQSWIFFSPFFNNSQCKAFLLSWCSLEDLWESVDQCQQQSGADAHTDLTLAYHVQSEHSASKENRSTMKSRCNQILHPRWAKSRSACVCQSDIDGTGMESGAAMAANRSKMVETGACRKWKTSDLGDIIHMKCNLPWAQSYNRIFYPLFHQQATRSRCHTRVKS